MPKFSKKDLFKLLEEQYLAFNQQDFIPNDPISIPHQYSLKQDIEITALWTAILSWGQRITIINKANELFSLMENEPFKFIKDHSPKDRLRFKNFKHRTFQPEDCYVFLEFLQELYQEYESLEDLFTHEQGLKSGIISLRAKLETFTGEKHRTLKHISTPSKNSACKRLNMFLRWMVRKDNKHVDFGIWTKLNPNQLYIPLDVHVGRVARHFGLLTRKNNDWQAVEELTNELKKFDDTDPVKYDFALFGMGVLGKVI